MSTEVTIRPFTKAKDDQKEIKSIFAAGMHDIVGRGWRKYYLSQLTNVYLPLHFLHTSLSLVSFLRPRSSVSTCKSSLLSCFMWNIALIMLPPIGWYALFKIAVSKYINSSFKNDLSDINAHYIEPEHRMSNFWVALKDAHSDEVIGTAAIEVHFKMPADFPQKAVVRRSSSQSLHHGSNPQLDQAGATLMRRYSTKPTGELRRLSVKKSHRNKGTAKKLLATAVDFCKKKGMEKVWFSITDLQPAAERLFVEHGFQFMFEHKIVGGLIGIRYYELDLSVPVIDITLK